MRTDGRVAGRAYGRGVACASECAFVRLSSGQKKLEWSPGKSLFIFITAERPICTCARVHGVRINVAEGAKQLMGLDLMRDGECAGAATEAEWPAKHQQLPFTFKSHKITPLTPSSQWRSSAPLSSALFSFSALLAVAQNWVFLSSLLY